MYFVICRYVLKDTKRFDELKKWMRENEALQAKWGAIEADFYRPLFGLTGLFYARYKVKSLDRWHEGLNSPPGVAFREALGRLVDFEQSEQWIFEEIPF